MADTSEDPLYKNLARKLLNVPALVQQKKKMLEPGVLDLVQEEWWPVLQNSPVYQSYKNSRVNFTNGKLKMDRPFTTRSIIGNENHMDVLVVGYFRLDVSEHSTTLIVVSCKATSVIGSALCCNATVQDNSRFFFEKCDVMCLTCRKRNPGPDNMWCVRQTKVFDGEGVRYAQRLYVQSVFVGEFVGMARLRIQSKIEFGNSCKICGICKDIVFMKENALNADDDLGEMLEWNGEKTLSIEEVDYDEPKDDDDEVVEETPLLALPQGYAMPTADARKYTVTSKKQRLI